MPDTIHQRPTAAVITLGCKVNQYESQAISERLVAFGFSLLKPNQKCDVYIINTCTVTAESDRKCRQLIRRAIAKNPDAFIIVCGCMAQVSSGSISKIDGVDVIIGNADKLKCADIANELIESKIKPSETIILTGDINSASFESMNITQFERTRAYLKIEDGCENRCTYCIIPDARGRIRSKPFGDVISEVHELVRGGCQEIVLTGIETGSYGRDTGKYDLADLLCAVEEIDGSFRIRTGSLDPTVMKACFVDRIKGLKKLAPHFHLSLQSGSDKILARMKRKYNSSMVLQNVTYLKQQIPGVMLTTDIITGFPGETEEDFLLSVELAKRIRFLNIHVFPYSERKGTPAAEMPDSVPVSIRHERCAELIKVSRQITAEILQEFTLKGNPTPVLFETYKNGYAYGHTPEFIEVAVKSNCPMRSQSAVFIPEYTDGEICYGLISDIY